MAGRLQRAMESYSNVDKTNPTALAIAAQGSGTSPVVALYRTGAIEEALKTRYLTGKDRYLNADRAGEKKDPQWVIDDNWTLYLDHGDGGGAQRRSRIPATCLRWTGAQLR